MDSDCHGQLAIVLAQQGQTEAAISEARRALELGPENSSVQNLLVDYLLKLNRADEAITVARDGLAQSPFSSQLHNRLGVSLSHKEDFAMATRHFVYSLLLSADSPEAHSNFRLALSRLGMTSDGPRVFQELEALAPDAPVILGEMAWFFATQRNATLRNGDKAVRLAEHAAALTNRKDSQILVALAAAYAETAKIPEAIKVAEEARLQARLDHDAETAGVSEKLLSAFKGGHPYRR
jgi:Flp pilus assembly protein TadD